MKIENNEGHTYVVSTFVKFVHIKWHSKEGSHVGVIMKSLHKHKNTLFFHAPLSCVKSPRTSVCFSIASQDKRWKCEDLNTLKIHL